MSRVIRLSASWYPGSGRMKPTFVMAGSVRTSATSRGANARSSASTSLNPITRVLAAIPRGRPSYSGNDVAVLEHHQRGVLHAVVLPVEHQHDVAARGLAREPDHLGVGLRRGQRELPFGHPVPVGEMLGDGSHVLAREEELVAERHPRGDGLDDRVGRMAAEPAHVGQVQVGVGVPVDVRERGALAVAHHDRWMLVQVVHPGHRDAARHGAVRTFDRGHRSRVLVHEAGVLRHVELADAVDVDPGEVGRHRIIRSDVRRSRGGLGQGLVAERRTRRSPRCRVRPGARGPESVDHDVVVPLVVPPPRAVVVADERRHLPDEPVG